MLNCLHFIKENSTNRNSDRMFYPMVGQYFGQKYFLTKQRRVRSATVRVPFDSVSVDIACLMPEQFSIWDSYRNVLLGKY